MLRLLFEIPAYIAGALIGSLFKSSEVSRVDGNDIDYSGRYPDSGSSGESRASRNWTPNEVNIQHNIDMGMAIGEPTDNK